jgi:hypothetical protein
VTAEFTTARHMAGRSRVLDSSKLLFKLVLSRLATRLVPPLLDDIFTLRTWTLASQSLITLLRTLISAIHLRTKRGRDLHSFDIRTAAVDSTASSPLNRPLLILNQLECFVLFTGVDR